MRKVISFIVMIGIIYSGWKCTEDTIELPTPYVFPTISNFSAMPANPENPATIEGVSLGKKLFYRQHLIIG